MGRSGGGCWECYLNAGTLQVQTTGNARKPAGCLLSVGLLLVSLPLSAQDTGSPDTAAAAEAPVAVAASDDSTDADLDTANLSKLSDEEAARKAEQARQEAEQKRQEAEQKRQQAEQAQQQAERVRAAEQQAQSQTVEGPPEAPAQQQQEAIHSARETAEQQASEKTQAAEQAEQEHRESSAEAEVLEKAADPETGKIYRALHQREGPIFGIRFNATLAVDGAKYQDGSALAGDSGFELRRARVGLYKGFGANWYARLTAEVSSGQFQVRDNFLGYNGWSTALLTFGIFSEPFSLESMTSFNNTMFMEQALPVAALAPGKSIGVSAVKRTESGIFTGGLFFRSAKQEGDAGEEGQAITLRYARSPLWRPDAQDTHVGISASYRINATTDSTRYRTRPESNVTNTRLVDTGNIEGAEKIIRIGADISRIWGPWSAQAEVMGLQVQRSGDLPDVRFSGAYVFGSWFLTGESRNYRDGSGVYGPITPNAPLGGGGKGAFELAARVSYLDASDKDIVGGQETNVTAGLNWYPKVNWRFSANLIKVLDVDRPGDEFDGQDPWIFTIRGQWVWD
jgi:phosphate-selective porin OprO/OprP